MTFKDLMSRYRPVWAPEDETGSGGENTGEGAAPDAGAGGDATDTAETENGTDEGIQTTLDGGTAEGEDNTSEDGGEGEKDGDGEDEAETEVPEEYDFSEVELPDGMEIDAAFAEAAAPVLKELGMNQEQANKLAGLYAQQLQAQAETQMTEVKKMITGWVDTAKADEEVGKGNWDESVRLGNAALRQFGTPELIQEVMVNQGLGNHPEVIRFMARVGKHVASDNAPTGTETEGDAVPPEQKWYGATTPTSKKG